MRSEGRRTAALAWRGRGSRRSLAGTAAASAAVAKAPVVTLGLTSQTAEGPHAGRDPTRPASRGRYDSAPIRVGARYGEAAGSDSLVPPPSARSSNSSACAFCGDRAAYSPGARPHRGLDLTGRSFGDDLPRSITALGELVGLLDVLGGEQEGHTLGRGRPDDVPHLVAERGSGPVVACPGA